MSALLSRAPAASGETAPIPIGVERLIMSPSLLESHCLDVGRELAGYPLNCLRRSSRQRRRSTRKMDKVPTNCVIGRVTHQIVELGQGWSKARGRHSHGGRPREAGTLNTHQYPFGTTRSVTTWLVAVLLLSAGDHR